MDVGLLSHPGSYMKLSAVNSLETEGKFYLGKYRPAVLAQQSDR